MRRFRFLLGAAVSTFTVGVILAWFWLSISKPSDTLLVSLSPQEKLLTFVSSNLPTKPLSEQVQIKFQSSEQRANPKYIFAKFQVTNGSSETLYYMGYSKDWHCSYKIKRDKKVESQEGACNCAMGLAERTLSPGESATYDIPVLLQAKTNKIEVGFDFDVGQERSKETFWTEEVALSK